MLLRLATVVVVLYGFGTQRNAKRSKALEAPVPQIKVVRNGRVTQGDAEKGKGGAPILPPSHSARFE